jgi:hypothetical protein
MGKAEVERVRRREIGKELLPFLTFLPSYLLTLQHFVPQK